MKKSLLSIIPSAHRWQIKMIRQVYEMNNKACIPYYNIYCENTNNERGKVLRQNLRFKYYLYTSRKPHCFLICFSVYCLGYSAQCGGTLNVERTRFKRFATLSPNPVWTKMPITLGFKSFLPDNMMQKGTQEKVAISCATVRERIKFF